MNIGLRTHKKRPRTESQYGRILLEFDRHPGHEHMKTKSLMPCRIVHDKIYTTTRTFCRETLKMIGNMTKDNTPVRGISYTLND